MGRGKSFWENSIVSVLGALICCLLWGSAFPFIKLGYRLLSIDSSDSASQVLFGGVRFIIAGVMVIVFGSFLQKTVIIPRKDEFKIVALISLFQTIGQYILFYIGMAHTSGVRGAIIIGSNAFISIIVACLIFRYEKLTIRKIIGSIIGFIGIIVINITGTGLGDGSFISGDLLVLLSTVCAAFSSAVFKKYSVKSDAVMLSGYQFFFGGLVMSAVGLSMGGSLHIVNALSWLDLIYLAFISAGAYTIWGILLKHNPISKITVIGFMNPVFGVILSALILKEGSSLGVECVIALALICVGIVIVNKEKVNSNG